MQSAPSGFGSASSRARGPGRIINGLFGNVQRGPTTGGGLQTATNSASAWANLFSANPGSAAALGPGKDALTVLNTAQPITGVTSVGGFQQLQQMNVMGAAAAAPGLAGSLGFGPSPDGLVTGPGLLGGG